MQKDNSSIDIADGRDVPLCPTSIRGLVCKKCIASDRQNVSIGSRTLFACMIFLLQACLCILLVLSPQVNSVDDSIRLSLSFGGDHGTKFSDRSSVLAGQIVGSITIRAGKRVEGILLTVTSPTAANLTHGGSSEDPISLVLENEEYISSMEAHWDETQGRTHISYLRLRTSTGKTVSGGTRTLNNQLVKAPKGFQLGGFFGRDGDMIFKLGAIWTRISAQEGVIGSLTRAPKVGLSSDDSSAGLTGGSLGDSEGSGSGSFDPSGSALDLPKQSTLRKKGAVSSNSTLGSLEQSAVIGALDASAASSSGSESELPDQLVVDSDETSASGDDPVDQSSVKSTASVISKIPSVLALESIDDSESASTEGSTMDILNQSDITSVALAAGSASGSQRMTPISFQKVLGLRPVDDSRSASTEGSPVDTLDRKARPSVASISTDNSKPASVAGSAFGSTEGFEITLQTIEDSESASTDRSTVATLGQNDSNSVANMSTENSDSKWTAGSASESTEDFDLTFQTIEDSDSASTDSNSVANMSTKDSDIALTAGSAFGSTEGFEITFQSIEDSDSASTDQSTEDTPNQKDFNSVANMSTENFDSASTAGSAFGSTEGFEITFQSIKDSDSASTNGSAADSKKDLASGSKAESNEGSASASAAGSKNATAPPPPKVKEPAIDVKDSVQESEAFGGPHGNPFSDKNFVNSGQKVGQVSIYAGKRLDGVSLEIKSPKTMTFTHGGTGGQRQVLVLGDGEYIKSMEVHWGKKDDHARIFFVAFTTSTGKTLSGGTMTNEKSTVTAPEGFQLAGFHGRDGKEIDMLGAVWAYIELVTPAPTLAPAPVKVEDSPGTVAPADIASSLSEVEVAENTRPVQLSDSFGGPHGEQFSDQMACTSGMIIKSVTIRAGNRLDGLIVQVSAPKDMTFKHGGDGGKEHILDLEPGEFITKMEVNVGQRNGRTRVFFLSLTTSKDKVVSGGSPTPEKSVVTAPQGYQLAGFFGRYGDEMDLVGAVWSSIAAINETALAMVPADEDIALGELFGGPHGNAFSDVEKIRFSQKIESVALRSAKRLDFIMLTVRSPEKTMLKHGGRGGKEAMFTLGPDEFITSMEVHTGKKDGRTRVFYIELKTTAGNTFAGGVKTGTFGTATAPDGFVLGGFYGRSAAEVDQIGAIWIRKTAKDILLTDPTGIGNGTYGTTIRNWVGPSISKSTDTACYRRTYNYDSNTMCPLGYGKAEIDCMARCPISYPVTCGGECIRQNDDCTLVALDKTASVLFVAANAATLGLLGEVKTAYRVTKWVVLCTKHLLGVIQSLIYYLRYRQTTAPIGESAEMLTMAYQADVVIFDLPIAVCVCLNMPAPINAEYSDMVLTIVEGIVKAVITQGDQLLASGANVLSLLKGNGFIKNASTTKEELEDLVKKNSTCGWELKRLTDRITRAVLRHRNASTSLDDVRVKVYTSAIVLNDIPVVTNNCMGELLASKTRVTAFETRDLLRKTFGVIVDQLIDKGYTDEGKNVAEDDYALEMANLGLVVLSALDPSGLAYMAAQFVQPICGPTAYVGEIDDGLLHDALGLKIVDEAFIGTFGFYTHKGDGVVHLTFTSVDNKDVTVVIYSGGDEYAKLDIGAGDVTTWDATFPELEDKTLYMDRWRPGLMGLPGKGGGSLNMWIPRSSAGGHITMHVRINPS